MDSQKVHTDQITVGASNQALMVAKVNIDEEEAGAEKVVMVALTSSENKDDSN